MNDGSAGNYGDALLTPGRNNSTAANMKH